MTNMDEESDILQGFEQKNLFSQPFTTDTNNHPFMSSHHSISHLISGQ